MKVATYCRFSSDRQRESSIADQLRNCERHADRQGWEITARFEDRALSGSKKDRPGYQQMLAAAKRHEFAALLVDDLSRLSRDDIETKEALRRLKFWGVRVIGVSDGFDGTSKGSKIQASVRGMMNEVFLDDLREKINRGMEGKALGGYSLGGKPYGYKPRPIYSPTEKDAYGNPAVMASERIIDLEQAEIVKEIFTRYADGWSPRRIADDLNARKVPSPGSTWKREVRRCEGWVGSSVTSILDNPGYCGKMIWKRSQFIEDPETAKIKRYARDAAEWITVEKPELRIVDQKTFDAVRARRAELKARNEAIQQAQGKTARFSPPHKYLFSSLLICGTCGANFVVKDPTRYGCGGHRDGGKHLCDNALRVPRRLLEERLLGGISERLFSEEAVARFRRSFARAVAERKRKARPDAEAARRKLAELAPQIERMVAAIADGTDSVALRARLKDAEGEAERQRALLRVDTRQLDKVTDFLPRAVDHYKGMIADLPNVLTRDVSRARAQLRKLIGTVRLVPEGAYLVAEVRGDYSGLFKLATGTAGENWFGRGRGI